MFDPMTHDAAQASSRVYGLVVVKPRRFRRFLRLIHPRQDAYAKARDQSSKSTNST